MLGREVALVRMQAVTRGALVRKDVLRSRHDFLDMVREVEGEEVSTLVSWGKHLSRPRFDGSDAADGQRAAVDTLEARWPSDDPGGVQGENPIAAHAMQAGEEHTAQQLESQLCWLKQALHAQRQARRARDGA